MEETIKEVLKSVVLIKLVQAGSDDALKAAAKKTSKVPLTATELADKEFARKELLKRLGIVAGIEETSKVAN